MLFFCCKGMFAGKLYNLGSPFWEIKYCFAKLVVFPTEKLDVLLRKTCRISYGKTWPQNATERAFITDIKGALCTKTLSVFTLFGHLAEFFHRKYSLEGRGKCLFVERIDPWLSLWESCRQIRLRGLLSQKFKGILCAKTLSVLVVLGHLSQRERQVIIF